MMRPKLQKQNMHFLTTSSSTTHVEEWVQLNFNISSPTMHGWVFASKRTHLRKKKKTSPNWNWTAPNSKRNRTPGQTQLRQHVTFTSNHKNFQKCFNIFNIQA